MLVKKGGGSTAKKLRVFNADIPVSRWLQGIPSEPAEEVLRQDLEKGFQGLLDVICVLEPNDLRPKYALTVVEHRGG
jgi:hypothetical protein